MTRIAQITEKDRELACGGREYMEVIKDLFFVGFFSFLGALTLVVVVGALIAGIYYLVG